MTTVVADCQTLALDRQTLRTVDENGHMRVAESRISKANVCGYMGSEINGAQRLGLDPTRVYYLLRDPNELAKAADTFTGKPLLIKHQPITADLPAQDLWVGNCGPVTWEAPYLVTRPLTVLTQEAIDLIESNQQRELSSGYHYEVVMESGTYEGHPYDGRMVNIRGQHVALVYEGRAGSDVLVADEQPLELKQMKHQKLAEVLNVELKDEAARIAFDGAIDAALEAAKPAPVDIDAIVDRAVKLALDKKAAEDDMDLTEDEMNSACDAFRKDCEMNEDAELTPAQKAKAYKSAKDKKMAAKDASPDHRKDFEPNKGAKDSAISQDALNAAVKAGNDATRKQMLDLMAAREHVQGIVGPVSMALDSADAVYEYGCKARGIETKGIHASAFKPLFDSIVARGDGDEVDTIAQDEKGQDLADISALFGTEAA